MSPCLNQRAILRVARASLGGVHQVKNWERKATTDAARRFVEVKEKLSGQIERRTVFLFYSKSGLSQEAEATLREAGVLILDPEKLARHEASSPL